MNARAETNSVMDYALAYGKAGLAVLPLHHVVSGACTCRNRNCRVAGRHPLRNDGLSRASKSSMQIHGLFRADANVGIATGAVSKMFVVVIDPARDGQDSLDGLEAVYGTLPATFTANTMQGRKEMLFKLPNGLKVQHSLGASYPGIEVKGDGDFIAAEPSTTPDSPAWVDWELGQDIHIAAAPAWLVALASGQEPIAPAKVESVEQVPVTPSTVVADDAAQAIPAAETMMDKALALLEKGFHVFPLGAYGESAPAYVVKDRFDGDQAKADAAWPKQPRLSWKAFQYAAPTEETVRGWWGRWSEANIGIACGELIVVDCDSTEASKWAEKNLPATPWKVLTGTEGKKHLYYRRNPACEIRNSADPAKVDIRGMGGYVVAGGSRHASGRYYQNVIDPEINQITVSDLPMLTKEHVEAIAGYRKANLEAIGGTSGNLAGFDAGTLRAKADGSPVAEGGRNNAAASLAGKYMAQGMSLRDTKTLLDGWNSTNQPPLSDSELNTVIASVKGTHERNHPGTVVPLETPPRAPDSPAASSHKAAFPKHLLVPPGLVGKIAAYINRTALKPQPVLALGASLALCGTLMGRKVRTSTDLRPNTYIVVVAETGAGKEYPRQAIKRLLTEAGAIRLLGAEDLASDAGLFAIIFKNPSCLLLIDEIGRFFRMVTSDHAPQFLVAIQTMFMKLVGSAAGLFFDKARAENVETALRMVDQPNVCLYGSTVPGRLFQSLKKYDITDGFLPRILCFHSDDHDPDKQVVTDKTPPQEILDQIHAWAGRSVNAYPKGDLDTSCNPLWVEASPDAQLVFDAFEAENRARKNKARSAGLDAMWTRADEHAMRLALIVACGCNFESPVIERVHAEWACAVVEFVLKRAIVEIDGNVGDTAHEVMVKKVRAYFKEHRTVEKAKLTYKFQGMRAFEMEGVIKSLQDSDEVSAHRLVASSGAKGGRPRVEWDYLG